MAYAPAREQLGTAGIENRAQGAEFIQQRGRGLGGRDAVVRCAEETGNQFSVTALIRVVIIHRLIMMIYVATSQAVNLAGRPGVSKRFFA